MSQVSVLDEFDFDGFEQPDDAHPIVSLMKEADQRWLRYDEGRSRSFREAVAKYRMKYGRHPPPGFKEVRPICKRKRRFLESWF